MTTRREIHAVVVGSGIAGLTAALHAARAGCRVTLVTKGSLAESNTRYAQGGIAGVMFADDSVDSHVRDTLVAGAGLSDPAAVRVLAGEGPGRIRELIARGVAFDRTADGSFVQGLEAAHSFPRVLHAGGDATGAAIEAALVAAVRGTGIRILEHAFLVDLVRGAAPGGVGDAVRGVDLLVSGERRRVTADAVVLATGGAGQLYAHTTNPAVATGDGIAAALRVGVAVSDLEFVQFHPTVLPATASHGAFLVSEAVRGEGAVLRDAHGERFMTAVHPDAELAPRDVVARAIAAQMARQGKLPVVLDASGLRETPDETAAFLARRFPTIDAAVHARGLDWARQPIPVTPAAHYLMGGIDTDLSGRTGLRGLYAVGETARTGVHGANRLASNSLLEGAVFGARVGDALRGDVSSGLWPARADAAPDGIRGVDDVGPTGPSAPPFDREALQALLWDEAGLVRDAPRLAHAASVLAAWSARPRPRGTVRDLEDDNLLLVARHLVAAGLARRTSVGAHFRSDAPEAPEPHAPSAASEARPPLHRAPARRPAAEHARKVPA